MDFAFFESLTPEEAQAFLENYLKVEENAVKELLIAVKSEGICADFTIPSVSPVLKWILDKIKTIPQQADETLPKWIRECDSYIRGLIDFDEPSKILVLRASYYLGESFVRYADVLTWATGDRETAEQNMPVVTGFQHGIEMAPMLIVENLSLRILADGAPYEDIDRAIKGWLSDVPGS
jgi:hypothetical protein